MAKPFTSSTAASHDNMNKCVYGDGANETPMILAFQVYYNGASWAVAAAGTAIHAGIRSEMVTGLTWNATTDELEIDLAVGLASYRAFTSLPVCVASGSAQGGASGSAANYIAHADADSATDIRIRFYDEVTGAQVTTEDIQMDAQLIMSGLTS